MSIRPRNLKFALVWLAGFAGVVSFLLVDLGELISLMHLPPDVEVPPLTFGFKLLALIQPTLLVTIAALVGMALSGKVGLRTPVIDAISERQPWIAQFARQIGPGLAGGVIGAAAVIAAAAIAMPHLPPGAAERISGLGGVLPLPTRLLYGGLTEEVLVRWGVMTFFVWAAWRLFAKARERPGAACFAWAIVASSFLFGIGHLPLAFLIVPHPGVWLVGFVIMGNSLFGLVAGWLYWKRGLESAFIAHATTHVCLWTASRLEFYF